MESYLLHDANASSNFKIMMMIQKEGMKGYGIYWMILEFLRVQNGYKADLRVFAHTGTENESYGNHPEADHI